MRRFIFIFLIGLALGVGYLILEKGEIRCQPIIAVWPGFTAVEPDPDLEYLAQGVGLNLESQLIFHGGVVVSTMDHWFEIEGAHEYAAAVGAEYLVDGSVQVVDDQIRITVKLFDTQQDRQLWTRAYLVGFAAYREDGGRPAMMQIVRDIHATLPDSVRRSDDRPCAAP